MEEEEEDKLKRASAQEQIESIWYRARINAFAHRNRMESLSNLNTKNYRATILFSLLSILFIIILYVILGNSNGNSNSPETKLSVASWAVIITLISVVCTFTGLYFTIMMSHMRHGTLAAEHKFLLNSYQYIAQRAREAKWPDKPVQEVIELLRDLERDFSLLKARGSEPTNDDFVIAERLMEEIQRSPTGSRAQSFPPPHSENIDSPED